MPKLHILTIGCQMNEYDSEKITNLFSDSHDFSLTMYPEQADLLIVNTCSVRHKAQEKLFSKLGQWKKLKDKNPNTIIAVGGCVASQEGEQILKRAPYVNIIFGPQTIHRLPRLYDNVLKTNKPSIDISFPAIEKFDHLPKPNTNQVSSYLTIMEGCSKFCTYCIVPYTRGQEISRSFDDVLEEAYLLANQGVREITLLGQNVNEYHGKITQSEYADLALLISYIAAIDGINRIRFVTSHPKAFSDHLIKAYQEVPELANHLHLPVQSGSDRVLKMMNRGYVISEYIDQINKLKEVRPNIKISTDIIVGFPLETENDFNQTLELIDEIGFDTSYSFIYSPRPGTPASSMPDNIPHTIKKERLAILQEKIRNNATNYSHNMINTTQNILVSGISKKHDHELTGRTECNRIVNFGANKELIGQFVDVKITDALTNSLRGSLLIS